MKTIGINAHLLSAETGYRQAGIHNYIRQLLNHLPPDDELRYLTFTQPGAAQFLGEHLTVRTSRFGTERPTRRILWEQAFWPPQLRGVDVAHSLAFVSPLINPSRKSVVTVFDLSFVHFPERFTTMRRRYLQTQTKRSVQAADLVVTIAEDGRRDVNRMFGVPLDKIEVVTPGLQPLMRVLGSDVVGRFQQEQAIGRFILHVGTLQPRKNIPVLLDAFHQADSSKTHKLVLVGGKGGCTTKFLPKSNSLIYRIGFTFPAMFLTRSCRSGIMRPICWCCQASTKGLAFRHCRQWGAERPYSFPTGHRCQKLSATPDCCFSRMTRRALAGLIDKVLTDEQTAETMRATRTAAGGEFFMEGLWQKDAGNLSTGWYASHRSADAPSRAQLDRVDRLPADQRGLVAGVPCPLSLGVAARN